LDGEEISPARRAPWVSVSLAAGSEKYVFAAASMPYAPCPK